MTLPNDHVEILEHLKAAFRRAERARIEARALTGAEFAGPALVWAVRSAEVLIRDFVLAPHFMEEGLSWPQAMRRGSNILGNSEWKRAFAKAEEWYGPFHEPLTEDGADAWEFWQGYIVRRRGDIVHGRAVAEVDIEEATEVCDFADRMASWFAQRFLTSKSHPIGSQFRDAVEAARRELLHDGQTDLRPN